MKAKMRSMAQNMEAAELKRGEPYYPTTHIDIKALPEISDWKVGETYKIVLEVEMESMSKTGAGFKMIKVGAMKGKE